MTQQLSRFSDEISALAAGAAPLLTAIRIGPGRQVTGFLWDGGLVVTTDQALPAAAAYTLVLANGALMSARPGPRDSANDLAMLLLDAAVEIAPRAPASGTAAGALALALGADFDGSPTVRLTTIHSFPRTPGAGGARAAVTLDLAGHRVPLGGMVIDATGKLLGMASVSPAGDAVVTPPDVIGRFVAAASSRIRPEPGPEAWAAPPAQTIPSVAVQVPEASHAAHAPGHHANGAARRGWLGMSLQPITVPAPLQKRAGQPTARQVVSVTRGGPAENAGLRSGDVLLSLDGTPTSGSHVLRGLLVTERIGSEVEVLLMRDGVLHSTFMTVAARP